MRFWGDNVKSKSWIFGLLYRANHQVLYYVKCMPGLSTHKIIIKSKQIQLLHIWNQRNHCQIRLSFYFWELAMWVWLGDRLLLYRWVCNNTVRRLPPPSLSHYFTSISLSSSDWLSSEDRRCLLWVNTAVTPQTKRILNLSTHHWGKIFNSTVHLRKLRSRASTVVNLQTVADFAAELSRVYTGVNKTNLTTFGY